MNDDKLDPPATEEELKEAEEYFSKIPEPSAEAKLIMPHLFTVNGRIKFNRELKEFGHLPNPFLGVTKKDE